jgi:hypothetical protein
MVILTIQIVAISFGNTGNKCKIKLGSSKPSCSESLLSELPYQLYLLVNLQRGGRSRLRFQCTFSRNGERNDVNLQY